MFYGFAYAASSLKTITTRFGIFTDRNTLVNNNGMSYKEIYESMHIDASKDDSRSIQTKTRLNTKKRKKIAT